MAKRFCQVKSLITTKLEPVVQVGRGALRGTSLVLTAGACAAPFP